VDLQGYIVLVNAEQGMGSLIASNLIQK